MSTELMPSSRPRPSSVARGDGSTIDPTITVTAGGLVIAIVNAPTLRPRLKVMVRVNGRGYNGIGRAVNIGLIGNTSCWAVLSAIDLPAAAVEQLAIGRNALRAEAVTQVELQALLRDLLAHQPAGIRAALTAAALAAASDLAPSVRLSHDLHAIREALRDHQPRTAVVEDGPPGVAIEVLARLDDHAVYVRGWIGYLEDELLHVTVVSPEGERVEVGHLAYRFTRSDVSAFYRHPLGTDDRFGFACTVVLSTASTLHDGWLIETETRRGALAETLASLTATDPLSIREIVVADLVLEALPKSSFRSAHVAPAIERLQRCLLEHSGVASVDQLGTEPAEPVVTIIVPLYKRIDFVQHQLAQFVHDPAMGHVDLIYVLDSPEIGEAFRGECRRLHRLYQIPFRAVVLTHNMGFSGANNIGAELARGRLLLLLNSDVLPDRPGWVNEMAAFVDRTPNAGAVAPKLLFEDGSLQHAGLYFERAEGASLWSNEHYFKGLHGTHPAANVTRRVPAITAACMMLTTDLYRDLGGLLGQYVQGDFEDSDLCMRMKARHLDTWYLASVELFHLEGQSYPTPMRVSNGEYNKWLHTHLWDDAITELMAAATALESPAPSALTDRRNDRVGSAS